MALQVRYVERSQDYLHCYGHSLNLATANAIKNSKLMKSSLDTTHEITKLIKYSPRQDAISFNV